MKTKSMQTKQFHLLCARLLKEIISKKNTLKNACLSTKNPKLYFKILHNTLRDYQSLENETNTKNSDTDEKYLKIILFSLKTKKKKNLQQKFVRINTLKKFDLKNIEIEKTEIENVYKLKQKFNYECQFYKNCNYFVQNISSCIPAFVLDPPTNSCVIDTCAAPGNKTTHVAAIMKNTGKIIAVEKDKKRFNILNETVEKSGAKNIKTINCDFTDLDPEKYKNVEFAIVDPSCSGSGIHKNYKKDEKRLKLLQKFQLKILEHLTKFEGIKRFVYSTCSVEQEENEEVVDKFIKNNPGFKIAEIHLKGFENGNENFYFYKNVVRVKPNENDANGFFVALFERI